MASKAVACWNNSVRSRPTLSALARAIDPWTFWEISPGASDFLVSDSGLFVRRPLLNREQLSEEIQSIGLAVDPLYFDRAPGYAWQAVGDLSWNGVAIVGTAEAVLASLRSSMIGPMDLLTHHEGFSIILGDALELAFIPNGDWASDPADSRLGAVLYHFGPRFRGTMYPLVTGG